MTEPVSPFRRLVVADPGTVRIEVRRSGEPSLWAVIDIEHWDLIDQHRWYLHEGPTTCYAVTSTVPGYSSRFMHQLILPVPDGMEVDHADHDGLNNRRSNLRVVTHTQNTQYRRKVRHRGGRATTSRFKGVSAQDGLWAANITVNGHREHLGRYPTEAEAARTYDRRAREAFGQFAVVNFPDDIAS